MTTQFLKKLAELDEGATATGWKDDGEGFIFAPDSNPIAELRGFGAGFPQQINADLICLLRNNSKAIRQLVELASELPECVGTTDTGNLDAICCNIREALANFKG